MLAALLLTAAVSLASPTFVRRDGVTTLSSDVVDAWHTVAYYAAAAYCPNSAIQSWSCGQACSAVPNPVTMYGVGGDNNANPYWYVMQNGSHIIVSICGTNPASVASVGNDIDFGLTVPDTAYFPDNGGAMIHHGFYGAFTRLAGNVRSAVQAGLNDGLSDILVIGHSLGGAIGHQVATYLQHQFPQARVYGRLFASPRVGNPAWANYVDSTLGERAQHMVNFNDLVPQLPPQEWGFRQSSNEVWISSVADNNFVACPGQENAACQDGLGLVAQVADFGRYLDLAIHLGPYAGVS